MQIEETEIKKAAADYAEKKIAEETTVVITDFEAGMRAALSIKTSLAGYGSYLIEMERLNHLERGYDPAHDDNEVNGEMAIAAALYAADDTSLLETKELPWPWAEQDYPDRRGKLDRKRQLVIAGALIAAEIDRLIRIEQKEAAV